MRSCPADRLRPPRSSGKLSGSQHLDHGFDDLRTREAQSIAIEVTDIDGRLTKHVVVDGQDVSLNVEGQVELRLVITWVEHVGQLACDVIGRRHGTVALVVEGKLIRLAGSTVILLVRVPVWPVTQVLIAAVACRIEIGPLVGQPVVARVVGSLFHALLGAMVVDIPPLRQLRFAVSTLAMKQCLERHANVIISIVVIDDVSRALA